MVRCTNSNRSGGQVVFMKIQPARVMKMLPMFSKVDRRLPVTFSSAQPALIFPLEGIQLGLTFP